MFISVAGFKSLEIRIHGLYTIFLFYKIADVVAIQ